jgi:D-3-phosphoglycerate dehydrogenase
MYKIRKHDKIAEVGLAHLKGLTLSTDEKNPEGIILRSYKLQASEFGEKLLAIGRAGAGVNNIPVPDATAKGIVVFNTPGANANAVKELVMASLLLSSRRIIDSANALRAIADRTDIDKKSEKMKAEYAGPEIAGKTLGVVGLGAIGVLVAQAAVGMEMNVIGYDPYLSIQNAWNIPREVKQALNVDSLVAECDYITIHVPLVDSTRGMFNETLFSRMKPGARLVNLARSEIVNIPDLIKAIEQEKVAAYTCDFPDERLLDNPKVITFPHLGASTPEAEDNCAVLACQEVRDYLEHGVIHNSVNFPNVHLERKPGCPRIGLLHKNVPKMLATISEAIGTANINIADMMNASRGDVAYTLLDVENEPSQAVLESLSKLPGVMRVRLIPAGK